MFLESAILLALVLALIFLHPSPLTAVWLSLGALFVILSGARLMLQMAPPFIPTPMKAVRAMLEFAGVKKGDRVYDLGCGDGRLLIEAERKGAIAIGYELSIPTLLLAKVRCFGRKNTRLSGGQVHVRYGDFWKKDLSDADVIFCYLLLDKMAQFERDVWPSLKPGCRVVSHMFPMPTVKPSKREGKVMVYVKN